MADSFRSEVNGSLWMVHWSIRLVRLEADHHHQNDRCETSKYCKSLESKRLLMLLNRSRGTLMSHIGRSVQRHFKASQRICQWFNTPNGSPNSFKTWIEKWNATVGLLGDEQFCFVFIFWLSKLSKNRQHCV